MAIEIQTNLNLEAEPSAPKHVVNVEWVEAFFKGKIKAPVRVVATTEQDATYNATGMELTYDNDGELEIDDETLAVADRVLLVAQGDTTPARASENGIYVVTDAGSTSTPAILTRSDDFNHADLIFTGVTISVNEGDEHANTTWKLVTTGTIILDTTGLEFEQTTVPVGASKYAADIDGDGLEDEWVITHGLNTQDVTVEIWNRSSHSMVLADVEATTGNTVTIAMANAPALGTNYRVVIIG
jgi:hypothetical protein